MPEIVGGLSKKKKKDQEKEKGNKKKEITRPVNPKKF